MYTLGLNTGTSASHDSSACLTNGDGEILAFIEEERLTRVRHAPSAVPINAVRFCLASSGLVWDDIDVVAIGWDEIRMAARKGQRYEHGWQREFLTKLGLPRKARCPDVQTVPHHRAHATSAFFASGFDRAAVLVVDGNGEDESISIFRGERGRPLVRVASWPRILSLGYMYEEVTDWLGFGRLNAGKTMGLAAYHDAHELIEADWFHFANGDLKCAVGESVTLGHGPIVSSWRRMINDTTKRGSAGIPGEILVEDPTAVRLAATAQQTVTQIVQLLAALAKEETGCDELCIAGGVALNCAANGLLVGDPYVPPVPHDAGVALGAAWSVAPPARQTTTMSPYTGGVASLAGVNLERLGLREIQCTPETAAELLDEGLVGAICRGRSEIGPRALGHRSIVASPKTPQMRDRVNLMKGREPWRPFGPVAIEPNRYWEPVNNLARYMVGATKLTDLGSSQLPAIRHVDGTTRPQHLKYEDEPFVYETIRCLELAGHPAALLNTSLNGPGEPLAETAEDALSCARKIGVDFVVVADTLFLLNGRR